MNIKVFIRTLTFFFFGTCVVGMVLLGWVKFGSARPIETSFGSLDILTTSLWDVDIVRMTVILQLLTAALAMGWLISLILLFRINRYGWTSKRQLKKVNAKQLEKIETLETDNGEKIKKIETLSNANRRLFNFSWKLKAKLNVLTVSNRILKTKLNYVDRFRQNVIKLSIVGDPNTLKFDEAGCMLPSDDAEIKVLRNHVLEDEMSPSDTSLESKLFLADEGEVHNSPCALDPVDTVAGYSMPVDAVSNNEKTGKVQADADVPGVMFLGKGKTRLGEICNVLCRSELSLEEMGFALDIEGAKELLDDSVKIVVLDTLETTDDEDVAVLEWLRPLPQKVLLLVAGKGLGEYYVDNGADDYIVCVEHGEGECPVDLELFAMKMNVLANGCINQKAGGVAERAEMAGINLLEDTELDQGSVDDEADTVAGVDVGPKIALVGHHSADQDFLSSLIAASKLQCNIVGSATSEMELRTLLKNTQPDIVLYSFLTSHSQPENIFIKLAKEYFCKVVVVVPDDDSGKTCFAHGADDYVVHPDKDELFRDRLEALMEVVGDVDEMAEAVVGVPLSIMFIGQRDKMNNVYLGLANSKLDFQRTVFSCFETPEQISTGSKPIDVAIYCVDNDSLVSMNGLEQYKVLIVAPDSITKMAWETEAVGACITEPFGSKELIAGIESAMVSK